MPDLPRALNRVPEITAGFWAAKLLSTALGESASDFLVRAITPEIAVAGAALVLAIALVLQFRSDRYSPGRYWFAVAMVGIFGTMAADVAHVVLGVPYAVSTAVFAVALAVIFVAWRRVEGTVSIHSITDNGRQTFYWLAVLATFALGTAAGDLLASAAGLGYLAAAVIFALLFVIPIGGTHLFRMNPVTAFWIAYVLTRPLGASVADWLGVSHERGGLALGSGFVALALAIVLFMVVCALRFKGRDTGNARVVTA